jgi:hypothetical protein
LEESPAFIYVIHNQSSRIAGIFQRCSLPATPLILHLKNKLYLDRRIQRQNRYADSRTRMPTSLAQDLDNEFRRTVYDLRLIIKSSCRGDESRDLDASPDPVKTSDC